MKGLDGNLNPDNFAGWVDNILSETDTAKREANWTQLLTEVHEEYLHVPIYGRRIPSIIAKRLSSYSAGAQQFDYPIHNIVS
jgi:ABC-type transport system substrate-binding protein